MWCAKHSMRTCSSPHVHTPLPLPHLLHAAFGLTVIEAMTCGLPTFATNHGGPSEIIKHKKSGEWPRGGGLGIGRVDARAGSSYSSAVA